MRKLLATLALCLLWGGFARCLPARPATAHPAVSRAEIQSIVQRLSEITGFKLRHEVPSRIIDREQLKKFLEQRIRDEIDPEEIRVEELILKKFGFVPQDFNLKKSYVDLYTEQAAAFYDFRKKRLVLLDTENATIQETALVHELAHALADQHFRLRKFLEKAGDNDDAELARMAVMEGQATWLMSEYMLQQRGKSLVTSPEMMDTITRMIASSSGQHPVLNHVPLYMRESLLFPYTEGMKFQEAVVRKMGKRAFAEVFRHPPQSTQQVIHPAMYFKRVRAKAPRLPRLRDQRSYRKLAEGVLGEFDWDVLLRQYAGRRAAQRLAPGWRGDRYRLLEHKKSKRTVLEQASAWSSPKLAREVFDCYRKVLEGKWKKMSVSEEDDGLLRGAGDDGFFLLLVRGSDVYSIEGMSRAGEAHP